MKKAKVTKFDIVKKVHEILFENQDQREAVTQLMLRNPKSE